QQLHSFFLGRSAAARLRLCGGSAPPATPPAPRAAACCACPFSFSFSFWGSGLELVLEHALVLANPGRKREGEREPREHQTGHVNELGSSHVRVAWAWSPAAVPAPPRLATA